MNRLALVFLLLPVAAHAQAAQDLTLVAPDGQQVVIDRDDYGVPHISAPTETALFYGQGFAVAQDRLFQMETFWRSATGRLSEIAGAGVLTQDKNVRTVFYTPAERQAQFEARSPEVRAMMTAYVAGINTYIDSTASNPARYLPFEYTQAPLASIGIERWDQDKLVATLQLFMRRFGEIGGEELTRLAELNAQGPAWFAANRPINDPTAATTIQGAPARLVEAPTMTYPPGTADFARRGAQHLARVRAVTDSTLQAMGVPLKFGSFAATISASQSASGRATILGAPQMGAPAQTQKAVTSEVELIGPDGLHIAGMTVPGIPGVIIGRANGRAWTLTTGYTDNTDTYIETLTSASTYRYNGADLPFEVFPETFQVLGGGTQTDTHFRTVHGPVYFLDAAAGQAAAWRFTFWNRELEMIDAFYDAWRATDIEQFQAAGERVTMSFNIFYADDEQNTAFWHVGKYPVRPATVDPRLPAMGDGSQEWTGEIAFADQPQQRNPASGIFANWNNKPAPGWPQGDNVPWAMGRGRFYDGVRFLRDYLVAQAPVSFDEVQGLTRVVRSNGTYNEYPGTYQQVVEFASAGCATRSENVIPPGQSGFVNSSGTPSPNFADQWALYQSSTGSGDVTMKPFTFVGNCVPVSSEAEADASGFGLSAPAPNPASRRASVRLTLDAASPVRVVVLDALGREVSVLHDAEAPAGVLPLSFSTEALAPGIYVVRASAGGRVASRRVVVAR